MKGERVCFCGFRTIYQVTRPLVFALFFFCTRSNGENSKSVPAAHKSMDEQIFKKASPTITTQIQAFNVIVLRWNKRIKNEAVARRCLLYAVHFSKWYSLLIAAKLIISHDGLAEYGWSEHQKHEIKRARCRFKWWQRSLHSAETVKNNLKKHTHINNWV